MPKAIAIDWNPSEVRYLVAELSRDRVQLLQAGACNRSRLPADGDPLESITRSLAELFRQTGALGAAAIIAIGRGDMDIYRLTLPPATDDELAALVHTQILSQAGAGVGEPVVDFLAPQASPNASRPVEAVVTQQETVDRYQTFGTSAGIRLKRLILRPYATASLRYRMEANRTETVLLVSILGSEVDLILASANRIHFWRTVQIPEDTQIQSTSQDSPASHPDIQTSTPQTRLSQTETLDALALEITRTLAVAPTQLPEGQSIEGIVLFGSRDDCSALSSMLEPQTEINIRSLDPTSAPGVTWMASPMVPSSTDPIAREVVGIETLSEPGRVAPLIGMLLDEAEGNPPAMDLLHPRRPPKPYNRRRLWILTAVAAAIFLITGGSMVSGLVDDAKTKSIGYVRELRRLRSTDRKLAGEVAVERSLQEWAQGDIVWLDELRDLSAKFPPAQDVIVRSMTISPRRGGGAVIHIQGSVRDPSVVGRMDLDLRIEGIRIATSTNYREQPGEGEAALDWRFETQIVTQRRPASAYRLEMMNPNQNTYSSAQ
ncbi:MAG: hypothetical protein JW829_20760 [Pirellulales bacterium]|nr:hypothetical protein [Pirellulales bacterium]